MSLYGFCLPLTPYQASLFVSYLFLKGYSSSTISTYASAVGYLHKIQDHCDPVASFMVKETVQGIRKINPSADVRAPITIALLTRVNNSISALSLGQYDTLAFQTMFSLAFFALLRISEIVPTRGGDNHVLKCNAVKFSKSEHSFRLTFSSFKHCKSGYTHTITVYNQLGTICPVHLLSQFLLMSKPTDPARLLFVDFKGEPYTRPRFCSVLRSALSLCGVPPQSNIRSHSFRIGGATYAASQGFSDAQIRYLGRWSSGAFMRYIRNI